jgi:ribosomal protein L37AE/L43A
MEILWLCVMFVLVMIPFGVAAAIGKLQERWTRDRHRRVARPEVLSLVKQVACPSCGASATITVGAAVHSCAHCGASLAATAEQMARGAWALAIAARRRLAAIRPPSPWWRCEREFEATVRGLAGTKHRYEVQPWTEAPRLAAALRGYDDMSHRSRWFHGYWPEATTTFMLRGSFVWGHHRGYPVSVDVMQPSRPGNLEVRVHVAAIATPSPSKVRIWNLDVHRSLSGVHARGSLPSKAATVEFLAYVIDELCLHALRGAFPPAPYVEPMVEAAGIVASGKP